MNVFVFTCLGFVAFRHGLIYLGSFDILSGMELARGVTA